MPDRRNTLGGCAAWGRSWLVFVKQYLTAVPKERETHEAVMLQPRHKQETKWLEHIKQCEYIGIEKNLLTSKRSSYSTGTDWKCRRSEAFIIEFCTYTVCPEHTILIYNLTPYLWLSRRDTLPTYTKIMLKLLTFKAQSLKSLAVLS